MCIGVCVWGPNCKSILNKGIEWIINLTWSPSAAQRARCPRKARASFTPVLFLSLWEACSPKNMVYSAKQYLEVRPLRTAQWGESHGSKCTTQSTETQITPHSRRVTSFSAENVKKTALSSRIAKKMFAVISEYKMASLTFLPLIMNLPLNYI